LHFQLFGLLLGFAGAHELVGTSAAGLNPAGGAGVRPPAQARADCRAARRRCSPGIDVLGALHGAANGACARTPAPPAWTGRAIHRH